MCGERQVSEGSGGLYQTPVAASILARAIRQHPDRDAIVSGNLRYTYRAYDEAISRVAQVLKSEGLKRGDGLAILSKNRPEFLFLLGAAHRLGLRLVPLHPFGSKDDHLFALRDAATSALFFDGTNYAEHAKALLDQLPGIRCRYALDPVDFCSSLADACQSFQPSPIEIEAMPEDIVQIIYTGGTTGFPKGVMWTQKMAVSQTATFLSEFEWPKEMRFLAVAPLSHGLLGLIPPVQAKAGLLVTNNGFDPVQFMEAVQRERITATFIVPTMIYALLDHPRIDEFDMSSLQTVIYGGSPISKERLRQALDRFGPIFTQLYGQTESTVLTCLSKKDHDLDRPHLLDSCGIPVLGVDLRLLDTNGKEVDTDEIGEICARSPTIMPGYWNLPDETAKTLRDGWLHTGDVAKRDARGYLYLVDRAKDMIISGGFNVYPREIEKVLEQHPAVAQSAIIGVPHEKWGEAVMGFVVLRPSASAMPDELISLVREKKGRVYAPKAIEIVQELPKTSVGKIDKKALRAPYWGGKNRQVS